MARNYELLTPMGGTRSDLNRARELREISRAQGRLPTEVLDEECTECARVFVPATPGQEMCRRCTRQAS